MGTSLRPYLPSKELTFQMVSLLSHRTAACGTAFPLLSDPRIAALLSTWCHLLTLFLLLTEQTTASSSGRGPVGCSGLHFTC